MAGSDLAKIRAEMAQRELARRNFAEYLVYTNGKTWKRTRFGNYLAQEVQAFTISVSKNGDKVEAKLLKGKTPVVDKSVDARLQPFESAMREISTTLGRDLLNLR